MPVSKRNRVVSLTQTKKKGLEHKQKLVTEIRDAVDAYDSIYIFSIENMRNNKLKEVREEWKGTSKFIMGKNKVLQLALGRNSENEIAENIHQISKRLLGQCGLFLTSQPEDEVISWFESFREPDFARAGFQATETVVLKEDDLLDFSHTMEPQFRRLGLPTKLVNGKIKLLSEFTVCTEGEALSPEMADVLKHKGIQMAEFHVALECLWKKDGTFKVLKESEARSAEQIKKSSVKRSKAKRARKSIIETAEKSDGEEDEGNDDDDDDDEDKDDSEEEEEEEEQMEQDQTEEQEEEVEQEEEEEEEKEEVVKKGSTKKNQKENRPIKKATRKITKPSEKKKETPEKMVQGVKTPTPPRRVTRASTRTQK